MKPRTALLTLIVLAYCILHSATCIAAPMGTAFTYQGRFYNGTSPAVGDYDFQFTLFDAATGGNQVGSTLTKEDINVSDGYFTTTLDFGSGRFTGDARWLQIAVRPGAETGSYTTLTPRHELTPTPYAINSDNEGTANYIPKFTSSGIVNSAIYESDGNIGIGTTSPSAKFHVSGGNVIFDGPSSRSVYITRASGATVQIGASTTAAGGYLMTTTASPLNLGTNSTNRIVISDTGNVDINSGQLFVQQSTGKVGIGTTTPGHLFTTTDTGTVAAVNLSNVLYVDAANERVGIGFDNPICPLDIRSSNSAGINIQSPGNPDVELRSTSGGVSVIDFSNDTSIDYDMRLVLMGDDTLTIDGGNVGVGTTAPTAKLHVSGDVYCSGVYQGSDEQLKTDVQPLSGVLDKLGQVRAVSFQWNEKAQALGVKTGVKQIGVLAQELEQAFPELVTTPQPVSVAELAKAYSEEMLTPEVRQRLQADADATHYKAVNYSQLTVVLLEAIKELQAENEVLAQRIQALENQTR